MRIESMDATTLPAYKATETNTAGYEQKVENKDYIDKKDYSQMTSIEKAELPISEKVVIEAIEKANKAISMHYKKFEFSIHDKTKEIMVKVIDTETEKVIREIPPEKILDLVATIWEKIGILVDERR